MPRLVGLLGRSWVIGTDDFAILCPCSAAVHIAWMLLAIQPDVRFAAWRLGVPLVLCDANATLCLAAALLDIVVTVHAAHGAVLDVEKRQRVPALLRLRVWLGMGLLAAACLASLFALWPSLSLEAAADAGVAGMVNGGSGPPPAGSLRALWNLPSGLSRWAAKILLGTEVTWHLLVVVVGRLVSMHMAVQGAATSMADASVRVALRWFGASDQVIGDIAEKLMQLLGDVDLVPSDVVFGLLLVSFRQKQARRGLAALAPDCGTVVLPPEVADSGVEQEVLQDLLRLAAFAQGVYGCCLTAVGEAAYEGTSIVSPWRLAGACCRACPCLQHGICGGPAPRGSWRGGCCCPPSGPVDGDNCCLGQSYALRRAAVAVGSDVELLWGTWEDRGLGSAPPFAVLLDRSARELIITIRGTFSLKDCIVDAACKPEAYDPWAVAVASSPREEAPESELGGAEKKPPAAAKGFYAHAGMLTCMRDVRAQLVQRGILDSSSLAAIGQAHGCRIVCTGHSLGAGIALLLALELVGRQAPGAVRYVGFEPPGCVLSLALARQVERLGWYSLVLEKDWVPRVSLRSLQLLREQVLDELILCRRSKFQLLRLLSERSLRKMLRQRGLFNCLRWPLAGICRLCCCAGPWMRGAQPRCGDSDEEQLAEEGRDARDVFLAGGPGGPGLGGPRQSGSMRLMEARRIQRNEPGFYAEEMCCPGRLVILRSSASEHLICGLFQRDTQWSAQWGRSEDLAEILIARRAIEYHIPHIFVSALRLAATQRGSAQQSFRHSNCCSSSVGSTLSSSAGSTLSLPLCPSPGRPQHFEAARPWRWTCCARMCEDWRVG